MQISLLLMEEIIKLFVIMFMGYTVVKAGLMKSSESKSVSVIMVYLVIPCVILNAFQFFCFSSDSASTDHQGSDNGPPWKL